MPPRFLVLTFPAQGHINPSLQFSKRLAAAAPGAQVTFVTTLSAHRRMGDSPLDVTTPGGGRISHAPFSDGYDEGYKPGNDAGEYLSAMSRCGSRAISDHVSAGVAEGRPYTCLIYSILLPWAGRTASGLGLPSFLLWNQPATVFAIYYHYFHGYEAELRGSGGSKTRLPGLSLQLSARDIPSFMDAGNTYTFALPLFKAQFQMLDEQPKAKVLFNTFDELEPEALRTAADAVTLIPVGPLIPSAFLDRNDPSDTSFGGDLIQRKDGRVSEWLRSQPRRSVVYVSFGSISVFSQTQRDEIAKALLKSRRPFLWVIREEPNGAVELSRQEELEKLGLIVPWCSQVEVLSDAALGCFVTHCGWNSTLESLVAGVPVVAVPQWSDQGTNAKMVEDFWQVGVRADVGDDGVVLSEELKRCVDAVMEGSEFGRSARKWRGWAREAVAEGGSSDRNLKAFVGELAGEVATVVK